MGPHLDRPSQREGWFIERERGRRGLSPNAHWTTLKKNFVSCPPAGCPFKCRVGTFFLGFRDFSSFFPNNFHVFYYRNKLSKKKEDIPASRLVLIVATRWTGNKLFLRVALAQGVCTRYKLYLEIAMNNIHSKYGKS